jgi:streptogramin lyase
MWFITWYDDYGTIVAMSAMTPAGIVTTYPLPMGTQPQSIASGPDGRVWFGGPGLVGAISASGAVDLFPIPANRQIVDMVAGPDGNLWFTEYPDNSIGRITPTGVFTRFPTYPATCCGPVSMTLGADGGFFIVFNQGKQIARMDTSGAITLFRPTEGTSERPAFIVESGPDGRIWFTTETKPRIGSMDPAGGAASFLDFRVGVPGMSGMTAGPDGNLWMTLREPYIVCLFECPPPDPNALPRFGIARVNLNPHRRRTTRSSW